MYSADLLASLSVMDYSLLVGVNKSHREIVLGVIDFIRQVRQLCWCLDFLRFLFLFTISVSRHGTCVLLGGCHRACTAFHVTQCSSTPLMFIHSQFTLDKALEMYVKKSGILGGSGKDPTILSPKQYAARFRLAMNTWLTPVPCGSESA